ncbi:hypothetical protein OH76DRAFT_856076 [Lentinus brumalis]|uniref:Uncharacterized protein n=1 Tax=Lentinus brumalis TaxID=2498619 RepID=A0A371DR23_9APHY|nr:hypothetical protein OH76DRAFT_856076 [Polyporus brumalis]
MPTEVAQRGVTPCPLMASPDPTPMHRVLNLNDPVLQPDTGCNCNPRLTYRRVRGATHNGHAASLLHGRDGAACSPGQCPPTARHSPPSASSGT